MRKNEEKSPCVLGIAPSSRGFGYAVMMKGDILVDWGVKAVKSGKKNERCVAHVATLVEMYAPKQIAVEDCSRGSHRSERIQSLIANITEWAGGEGIDVELFSRKQVSQHILCKNDGTKLQVAENLANRYPQQLSFRVPPRRRVWMGEPYQMDIFDAVALAQCCSRRLTAPRYSKNCEKLL